MKKAIPIMLMVLATHAAVAGAATPPAAQTAEEPTTYTVVLAGGSAQNVIRIWLTEDGRTYVIDSVVPLEVGGTVCENPPDNSNELVCQAPLVAGFEVNGGPVSDLVSVAGAVEIPVTMRGSGGADTLIGGSGPDKLIGGDGRDRLFGRAGNDLIYGGPGNDVILGGSGDDTVRGGDGQDRVSGSSGDDSVRQALRQSLG